MQILAVECMLDIEKINQGGEEMKRFLLRISHFCLVAVYSVFLISCEPPQSKETAAP